MLKKILFVSALMFATAPAFAVDLTQPIKDVDGTIVQDQFAQHKDAKCGDKEGMDCLTLGAAITHALLFSYADERDLTGEEKFKRGILAEKIMNAPKYDFSAEDVVTIKKLIGKLYGPFAIIQVYKALDPSIK